MNAKWLILNAELFCEIYQITKNKHNVFFVKDKVMHFDWLKSTLQKDITHWEEINEGVLKEFISRLDIYAKPSNLSSPYFRKGKMKYGLFPERR